jgi:hypothetical protein
MTLKFLVEANFEVFRRNAFSKFVWGEGGGGVDLLHNLVSFKNVGTFNPQSYYLPARFGAIQNFCLKLKPTFLQIYDT